MKTQRLRLTIRTSRSPKKELRDWIKYYRNIFKDRSPKYDLSKVIVQCPTIVALHIYTEHRNCPSKRIFHIKYQVEDKEIHSKSKDDPYSHLLDFFLINLINNLCDFNLPDGDIVCLLLICLHFFVVVNSSNFGLFSIFIFWMASESSAHNTPPMHWNIQFFLQKFLLFQSQTEWHRKPFDQLPNAQIIITIIIIVSQPNQWNSLENHISIIFSWR